MEPRKLDIQAAHDSMVTILRGGIADPEEAYTFALLHIDLCKTYRKGGDMDWPTVTKYEQAKERLEFQHLDLYEPWVDMPKPNSTIGEDLFHNFNS